MPASGEETMSSSERRVDPRVNIRVPLRFRALNIPNSTDHDAESENISSRGIYFETDVPLKVGTPLAVSLRMPRELSGKSSADVSCIARVVHVNSKPLMGGRAGVGLHIERYETRSLARERWTS
jgi:PilZ domain